MVVVVSCCWCLCSASRTPSTVSRFAGDKRRADVVVVVTVVVVVGVFLVDGLHCRFK